MAGETAGPWRIEMPPGAEYSLRPFVSEIMTAEKEAKVSEEQSGYGGTADALEDGACLAVGRVAFLNDPAAAKVAAEVADVFRALLAALERSQPKEATDDTR